LSEVQILTDVVVNIDEFILVGRCKWDVIGHDEDPIYDIEGHIHLLPLQQPYVITTDFDVWQQGDLDDMIADLFQLPRDDFLQHSRDDFRSYPGRFDTYSFEHLDLLDEEDFQPSLCSNFDEGEDMIFPKQDFCDEIFQPSSFPSSRHVIEDAAGKHIPYPRLSPR
jgi:hypothetical protein